MAVQIVGLKKQRRGKDGTCSATDIVMVMPKERAWRLSAYRQNIENLSEIQTAGPPIEVPWSSDGVAKTQADMPRSADEAVGERAVARDWLSKERTISEYGEVGYNDNKVFREAPREEYEELARLGEHNPLVGFEAEDYEGSVPNYKQMRDFELAEQETKEKLKAERIRLAKLASGTPHSIVVEPEQNAE
ncbi:hypothetical protein Pmar_PMAR011272, partial [Perkinsus marinus ATCC 50983]